MVSLVTSRWTSRLSGSSQTGSDRPGRVAWSLRTATVLTPRGGPALAWVHVSRSAVELARVAAIAATKHRLLRTAVWLLVVAAVLTGASIASLAGVR